MRVAQQILQGAPHRQWTPGSTMRENFAASFNYMFNAETSVPGLKNAWDRMKTQRKIMKLESEGKLSPWEIEAHTRDDGNALSTDELVKLARAKGLSDEDLADLYTRAELDEMQRDEYFEIKQEYVNVASRASGMAKVAGFAGMLTGAALDPLLAPSYFYTPSLVARGLSVSKSMLKGAGIMAAMTGVEEALIQNSVYRYKHRIGADYSLKTALINVGAAVGISSVLGMAAGGFAAKLSKAAKHLPSKTPTDKYLRKSVDQLRREAEAGGDAPIEKHMAKIDQVLEEGENTSKPKADPFTKLDNIPEEARRVADDTQFSQIVEEAKEAGEGVPALSVHVDSEGRLHVRDTTVDSVEAVTHKEDIIDLLANISECAPYGG